MSLPCGVEELRETLNRLVELEEDNETYRKDAVEDAKVIYQLRCRIGDLMGEIRELKNGT